MSASEHQRCSRVQHTRPVTWQQAFVPTHVLLAGDAGPFVSTSSQQNDDRGLRHEEGLTSDAVDVVRVEREAR